MMNNKKQPESNEKAHKLSLSRRSLCVKKKASELAVLCDASICLIQFDQDGQLNTFPEGASELNNVLKRYLCVGEKVLEKRKLSSLSFQGGDGTHGNDEGSPPSLGDELLDTKSALELQNFKQVLDTRMKKLEERIKLLKGVKILKRKQKTSTFLQFYGDGTPFSPDDLQLSCNFSSSDASSKHDGIGLEAPLPDLSLSHHHIGLAPHNVMTDEAFCSIGQPSTNSSSYDSGIQKMNNEDSLGNITMEDVCWQHLTQDSSVAEGINRLLKGDGSAEKKPKTARSQLVYQDGLPCFPDDLQRSIKFCGSGSPFFCCHKGLAVYPTNLLFSPFQSIEAGTNVAQEGFWLENGCEMESAKEQNEAEDVTANNNRTDTQYGLMKVE